MRRNGHKFNAVKTTVDNITFASKAEAKRYGELKLLEKAGEIRYLRLQPKFPLVAVQEASGERTRVGTYIGDFAYCTPLSAAQVVEDVKGFKTALYKWKARHMKAQYGITITEITR